MAVTVVAQGAPDFLPRSSPQAEDTLLFQNLNLPNGSPQTFSVTLDAKYLGLKVVIESPNFQNDMQVNVTNQGSVPTQLTQTQILGVGIPGTYLFPMVTTVGDVIKVVIVFTAALTGGSISVYGARAFSGVSVRSDGRLYPQNTLVAEGTFAATTALVGAPLAPSRFLIGGCSLTGSGNGLLGQVVCTVEGSNIALAAALCQAVANPPPTQMARVFPQGVLCDPGTQILFNLSSPGGFWWVEVEYDIVV